MRSLLVTLLILLLVNVPIARQQKMAIRNNEKEDERARIWADSVFNTLTDDERLGQLFMVRAHSDKDEAHENSVRRLIEEYKVGGLCFFQGTPSKQALLTNDFQSRTKIPLLVSMDAEWGLGMRLKNTQSYPRQLMLGAISDNRLLYAMGAEVARQCKMLGVTVNFAPVVDINNNRNNPVIGDRSFGEDRNNVVAKSYMYAMGMQDNGVMACAKHFPGHGDTDVDSHLDLPVIRHNRQRLDSIELFPFRVLAQKGLMSMMIAHLSVPELQEGDSNKPTSLTKHVVTDILKKELGFKGLVFTDGLEMKGVTKYFKSGEVEAKALEAGNDILLLPADVPSSVVAIKNAIANGSLSWADIHEKCKKVLTAKYQLGLQRFTPLDTTALETRLNDPNAQLLKRNLIAASITVVRNEKSVLPIYPLEGNKIASLAIGTTVRTPMQRMMSNYATITHYNADKDLNNAAYLLSQLKSAKTVVVSLHGMSKSASKNYDISAATRNFIEQLCRTTNVILVVNGSPYSLSYFDHVDHLVQAYNDETLTQEMVAQALFGAMPVSGRLPITASEKSYFGCGISLASLSRLQYSIPEDVGLSTDSLANIEKIATEAIEKKATPGMQVLVAKNGKVVYQKSFGHFTYESTSRPVQNDDLYDLASVTKVCATTISLMKLLDEGKISIYNSVGQYLPEMKGTNKETMSLYDILRHRAGLTAWIPFYKEVLDKKQRPDPKVFSTTSSADYNIPVAQNLYMKGSYLHDIWAQIGSSELRPDRNYKYSDLGFYMFAQIIKNITQQSLDQFADQNFYQRLGLSCTAFNPLSKFDQSRIVPTERDNYFRYQTLQGYVHDMGAAMLGGISGHAGLFSNANDVAIIFQMLLNDGYYGGVQYLNPNTIRTFTTRYEGDTRRGLGFDMPELGNNPDKNVSELCSPNTFGHLGFTGNAVWADPDKQLIVVVLSNRTYPTMDNKKFIELNIRPRIQSAVYKALL
jgi:beta-N-acetylhexosaminidase